MPTKVVDVLRVSQIDARITRLNTLLAIEDPASSDAIAWRAEARSLVRERGMLVGENLPPEAREYLLGSDGPNWK